MGPIPYGIYPLADTLNLSSWELQGERAIKDIQIVLWEYITSYFLYVWGFSFHSYPLVGGLTGIKCILKCYTLSTKGHPGIGF